MSTVELVTVAGGSCLNLGRDFLLLLLPLRTAETFRGSCGKLGEMERVSMIMGDPGGVDKGDESLEPGVSGVVCDRVNVGDSGVGEKSNPPMEGLEVVMVGVDL